MIPIKTRKEIEIMREGGKRLGWILDQVLGATKPGVSLKKLDQLAESLIKNQGGEPSFKMVKNYNWATCINVNQGVVHGIPNEYQIKEGDLISVDMGMFYKELHTDMAKTICAAANSSTSEVSLGGCSSEMNVFLKAGKGALKKAIKMAKPGNRVGHISAAIEREIRKSGFNPIKSLTGHGVGKKLHEEPQIPCFLKGEIKDTPLLKLGMTLAIEVIYTQGNSEIILKSDKWTTETADGELAGLFEETIAVTKKGPIILTKALNSKLDISEKNQSFNARFLKAQTKFR